MFQRESEGEARVKYSFGKLWGLGLEYECSFSPYVKNLSCHRYLYNLKSITFILVKMDRFTQF